MSLLEDSVFPLSCPDATARRMNPGSDGTTESLHSKH